MLRLSGLTAFPITPADAEGRVEVATLRGLLRPLIDARVDSIGLLGSTGIYAYLPRAERRRALEAAVAEVDGRVPILVGVGALRTDEAVALSRDAKAAGAAAGLLAAMSYTPLTDDEVFEHFATVARESGLPLCIYDNPGTTHFRFGPGLVGRLARVPGIVAIKSPAPEPPAAADHVSALRHAVPAGFPIGYSGDWNVAEALLAGADGWYSVAAGLFPEACAALVRAGRSGDAEEVRRRDAALLPLWALFKEFSSLRVMYALARTRGLCRTDPPRPILPLPESVRVRIARVVEPLDLR